MANNNIEFIRGDTKILLITVTDNNAAAYTPMPGDTLTMTVRDDNGEKVIEKVSGDGSIAITEGKWKITINPSDTAALPFGNYIYDIQVELVNGYTQTIVPLSILTLKEEVSY